MVYSGDANTFRGQAILIRIVVLLLFYCSTIAGELDDQVIEKEPANFCQDWQAELDNEKLVKENPNDKALIKLVALRAGLCYLVGKKIVDFDLAVDLFDAEQHNEAFKRMEEEREDSINGA